MNPVDASVLIATRNRPALLERCLAAILANTRSPREVIVADQSDNDATEATTRRLGLVYRRFEPRGKSAAVNRAAELAQGEFLALTDDDVLVEPSWLERFDELRRENPETDAFCGGLLPETGTRPETYLNLVLGAEPRWIGRRGN